MERTLLNGQLGGEDINVVIIKVFPLEYKLLFLGLGIIIGSLITFILMKKFALKQDGEGK